MNTDDLKKALRKSWKSGTSSDPRGWSLDNPAWGQCVTTALIVQDIIGGDIVWAEAELPDGRRISHYFNVTSSEVKDALDFTREQFPEGTIIPRGTPKTQGFATTRDYVLSYENTQRRYRRLKRILERNLQPTSAE